MWDVSSQSQTANVSDSRYNGFLDKGEMIKLTMSPAEIDPKVRYFIFG